MVTTKQWGARLLILVSFISNIYLMAKVVNLHADLLMAKLDPYDQFGAVGNEANNSEKNVTEYKDIIFFGDSRISQWTPLPQINQLNISMMGRAGETSAQLLMRVKLNIDTFKTKHVVIQVGINDLKVIALKHGYKDRIVQNTENNIGKLLRLFRRNNIYVYLMTIIPPSKPVGLWRLFWSDEVSEAVMEVNSWIKKLSEDKVSVINIDYDSGLVVSNRVANKYSKDTLHLNKNGYIILNKLLEDNIKLKNGN